MDYEAPANSLVAPSTAPIAFPFCAEGAVPSNSGSTPAAADELPRSAAFELMEERLRAHEYERLRMGRDLHDSAGQLVISLELSLARLREIEGRCSHEALIEEIQETVRKIDNEIRTLAFLDYPAQLRERGLFDAVRTLARGMERRTGIRTTVETIGSVGDMPEDVATALLRVAQEALANIHRHAHASIARIVLRRFAGAIQISVRDNGVGMASAPDQTGVQGIGMQGMRHRIEALRGAFKVTRLKHGTRISALVPLPA
jgi:signal transduction histidine kinase